MSRIIAMTVLLLAGTMTPVLAEPPEIRLAGGFVTCSDGCGLLAGAGGELRLSLARHVQVGLFVDHYRAGGGGVSFIGANLILKGNGPIYVGGGISTISGAGFPIYDGVVGIDIKRGAQTRLFVQLKVYSTFEGTPLFGPQVGLRL